MNKCIQCSKEYKPLRATSKFCSDYCRIKYNRVSVSDDKPLSVSSTPKVSVSRPKKVSVSYNPDIHERPLTLNEKQGITEYGKCHSCKTPVSHLICICSKCTTKDITHKSLKIDIDHC